MYFLVAVLRLQENARNNVISNNVIREASFAPYYFAISQDTTMGTSKYIFKI